MKYQILLKNAFFDLHRNTKRTVLTMLGIIIGISSVITIIALGRGFEKYTVAQLTPKESAAIEITVYFKFNNPETQMSANMNYFNPQDILQLQQIGGVKKVKANDGGFFGVTFTNSTLIEKKGSRKSIQTEGVKKTMAEIIEGRAITEEDNQSKNRVAVIDQELSKSAFGETISPIGRPVKINQLNYTIIGVKKAFDQSNPNNAFSFVGSSSVEVPKQTLKQFEKKNKVIQQIKVEIKKGEDVSKISKKVVDYLNDYGSFRNIGSYHVFNLQEQLSSISKVLGTITVFISLIAAISLLIAGIGMMNMMYISVSERTKEIGIRRAIGATKGEIQLQFMLEGLITTVIGGLIGYVLGIIIAKLAGVLLKFPVSIELLPILVSLGISLSIGIFFSWSPAKSAANKNVIDII